MRGAGPPSPVRLSCLSPIVETNSRTAVQDEEDDQPEVDQHLSPREEDAMELELERLRIEERFHGAFESCGGSSLDSLELRALSSSPASSSLGCGDSLSPNPSPDTFAHLLQRQREALRKVPEKRKAERSTRISRESLQEVAREQECKGCHHCRTKEPEKEEARRGVGVTLASSSLLREALARSSIDIDQVVVSRQDMKLLEVLAGRVRDERREEEVRQRLLQEWQAERRRREEEKEEEERQVVALVRERRRKEEEEARTSLERARKAFLQSQEFLKHLLEEQKEERRRLLEALQKQKESVSGQEEEVEEEVQKMLSREEERVVREEEERRSSVEEQRQRLKRLEKEYCQHMERVGREMDKEMRRGPAATGGGAVAELKRELEEGLGLWRAQLLAAQAESMNKAGERVREERERRKEQLAEERRERERRAGERREGREERERSRKSGMLQRVRAKEERAERLRREKESSAEKAREMAATSALVRVVIKGGGQPQTRF